MYIRKAKSLDYLYVAKIHKKCLDKSFLATLGEKFLRLLYKALVEYKKGILLVAEDDGKIIGFVSATANTGDFYRYFLKKKFIKASFLLLPKAINLNTLRKIFETLKYSKKKLEQLKKKLGYNKSDLDFLEDKIKQFSKIDKGSYSFRYPIDKQGNLSLPSLDYINLKELSKEMSRVGHLLNSYSACIYGWLDEFKSMKEEILN